MSPNRDYNLQSKSGGRLMVGVPGTMKGHIEDARWEATTLDPDEKEWVVMTDNEVNYNWFFPVGKGAEAKFVAHLIAKIPEMLRILDDLILSTDLEERAEWLAMREAYALIKEIESLHPPIVRVEDLPKTEEEAKQMARDLGVSED